MEVSLLTVWCQYQIAHNELVIQLPVHCLIVVKCVFNFYFEKILQPEHDTVLDEFGIKAGQSSRCVHVVFEP